MLQRNINTPNSLHFLSVSQRNIHDLLHARSPLEPEHEATAKLTYDTQSDKKLQAAPLRSEGGPGPADSTCMPLPPFMQDAQISGHDALP